MMKNVMLWVCLAAYGALTALIIFSVPIGAAPDEHAHLEYVKYLAEVGRLPVFEPLGANHPGYEFHQPPLYYGLCALVWKALPATAQPYAARLVSLLCGALTLVLLWHSIRLLFPDDKVLAPLATGFAALWPLHIGVGASAGNDALAGLMCAGIFWSIARLAGRVAREEYSWRDTALIGVFFGLGMLSKSSCLPIGIAGVGAAIHLARQVKSTSSPSLRAALVVVGMAFLICGWWLVRNTQLYGDPLAARIFDEAFKNSSPRPQALMAVTGASFAEYLRAYFIVLFATCWGFFGGPNTTIEVLGRFPFRGGVTPEAFLAVPFMLICLTVTVLALWGAFKRKFEGNESRIPVGGTALQWWGAGLVLICLALLRFNFIQFQAQARYLHPALLPMALIFALGWRQVLGSGRALQIFALLFAAVLIAITLWNAFGWKTLV